MQVVRWEGAEAVVRVETPTEVVVAVPAMLPSHDVLDLARLVLTGQEYHELRRRIQPRQAASRASRGPGRQGRPRRTSPGTRGSVSA